MRRRPAGAAASAELEETAVAEGSTVAGVEQAAEQEAGEARTLSCAVMESTSPPTMSSGAGGASLTVAASAAGAGAPTCAVPRCVIPH